MESIWEFHKNTLHNLYVIRNETLKDIMSCMSESHGFAMRCGDDDHEYKIIASRLHCHSKSKYELHFKKWGFRKYSKAERWAVVSRKVAWRQTQGKRTVVRKDGEEIPQERLVKERRHASAMDLVQFGMSLFRSYALNGTTSARVYQSRRYQLNYSV